MFPYYKYKDVDMLKQKGSCLLGDTSLVLLYWNYLSFNRHCTVTDIKCINNFENNVSKKKNALI